MPPIASGRVHAVGLHGYQLYVPGDHDERSRVLVVAHGETGTDQDVPALAEWFAGRWRDFADDTGTIVVAPAFTQLDYGSHGGAFGGYRGLYGRTMGADEFVENILADVERVTGLPASRRFLLYGHSAGGQFANRFPVRHPHRVAGAALAAPGRYAFPEPEVAWHYGMDRLRHEAHWDIADQTLPVAADPDPDGWLEAACLPVTVVVGDEDTDPQPCRPAHCQDGWGDEATRIQIGRRWVERMNDLAERNGRRGRVGFRLVPGAGHHSTGLDDACQEVLRAILRPEVPDLVGRRETEATRMIEERLLEPRIRRRLADRPKGLVAGQLPEAGRRVPIGSGVTLDVSLGEREPEDGRRVPDVIGMRDHEASAALQAEGFEVSLSRADDDRPRGRVISQRPAGGDPAPPGSEVLVVASRGRHVPL